MMMWMQDGGFLSFGKAFSLEGELALISGGGTGLGLGIATAMVRAGARVVLIGRRAAPLEEACATLGPAASHAVFDVTRIDEAGAFIERVESESGPVSILVNNAGNHSKKPIEEHTDGDFRGIVETHVTGAFGLTRAAVPHMKKRGRGSILFTASMASLFGIPNVVAYAAAKSAYLGMIRSLAVELGPHGIRVNGIAPGWILTALSRMALEGDPQRRDRILARTPLGRFGEVEDVGWAAVYLCSPAARYLNGVVLPVDGGMSVGF